MKLDSSRLEAFFAAAKTKNFSRAARAVSITQSALSQRIAKLEDELETALFIRATDGIKLTPAGEALLRHCHMNQSLEDELLGSLRNQGEHSGLGGVLRIGSYSSVTQSVIMPALQELLINNPRVNLEIQSAETSELANLLHSGEVDYVVLNCNLEKLDVETVPIGQEENVLVRNADKEVRSDWYLDHDHRDNTTQDFFRLQGEERKAIKRSFVGDVHGIKEGVRLGLGRAVISKHLVKKDKEIRIISRKKKMINPVVLHFYKRPYYTHLHDALIEALKANVRSYL